MLRVLVFLFLNPSFAKDICELHNLQNLDALAPVIHSSQMDNCQTLKVGEVRSLKVSGKFSPTTVEQKYQIKRVSEKEYHVSFNVNFIENDTDNANRTKNRAYDYVWRKLANKCLEKVNGRIKGPDDQLLTFSVDENKKSKIPKVDVALMDGDRADSHNWEKNMPCSTVFHELLHLTGLVDQYQEKEIGLSFDIHSKSLVPTKKGATIPAYDCRAVGENPSIMRSDTESWEKAFATKKIVTEICECAGGKELCEKSISKPTNSNIGEYKTNSFFTKCPEGFKVNKLLSSTFYFNNDDLKKMEEMMKKSSLSPFGSGTKNPYLGGGGGLGDGISAGATSEGQQDVLPTLMVQNTYDVPVSEQTNMFESTYWNVIVYPGCYSKNWAYYQAAENSYRTSVANGGKGCVNYSWPKVKTGN